ncbi:MAG: exo-alpha-sialidase [Euryarchaeota archaeon]|nr:exo-alpha-sialidase [Euryarchaeota archaeon]
MSVIDQGTRWAPSVTVNPRDPNDIVAASMDQGFDASGVRRSWPLAHVSHDGGGTWTTLRLPMGSEAGAGHPLAAHNNADDPMVLFLPDGTLLYSALTFAFLSAERTGVVMTAPSISLWRSTDRGRSFPDARVLHAGSGTASSTGLYVEFDKQWLAAGDDGLVLMAWNRNEQSTSCSRGCTQTWAASSSDGGRSWTAPGLVYKGVSSGAFPLVLADGSWVVSYRETDDAAIHVAVSTDRGATWAVNRSIDSTTKFPVLAKTSLPGRAGERVYMAYPMTSERRGQPDVPQVVTLRWSDDGGRSWSAGVALDTSDAPARTSPALAAVEGSAIVTHWHPTGSDATLRATFRAVAVSPQGLVSAPLDLDTHEGTTRSAGDYMALVSVPGVRAAYAVWNARHGADHVISGARLTLAAADA